MALRSPYCISPLEVTAFEVEEFLRLLAEARIIEACVGFPATTSYRTEKAECPDRC